MKPTPILKKCNKRNRLILKINKISSVKMGTVPIIMEAMLLDTRCCPHPIKKKGIIASNKAMAT